MTDTNNGAVTFTMTRELKAVANAAAEDEGRYLLNNVLIKDGYLWATDGRALVRRPVSDHTPMGQDQEFLVPRSFIQSLKIPKGREATAICNGGELQVIQPSGTTTACKLEDPEYFPDVSKHVMGDHDGPPESPTFRLKARLLLRVLQALGPIDKNGDVTLHFTVPSKSEGIQIHLDDGSFALVMPVVV